MGIKKPVVPIINNVFNSRVKSFFSIPRIPLRNNLTNTFIKKINRNNDIENFKLNNTLNLHKKEVTFIQKNNEKLNLKVKENEKKLNNNIKAVKSNTVAEKKSSVKVGPTTAGAYRNDMLNHLKINVDENKEKRNLNQITENNKKINTKINKINNTTLIKEHNNNKPNITEFDKQKLLHVIN